MIQGELAPAYIVRNTFIEVKEEGEEEQEVSDIAEQPAYRRRRGSSFFRSSSEPLATSRSGKGSCTPDDSVSTVDSHGEDRNSSDEDVLHGLYSDEVSTPLSSRSPSPSPFNRWATPLRGGTNIAFAQGGPSVPPGILAFDVPSSGFEGVAGRSCMASAQHAANRSAYRVASPARQNPVNYDFQVPHMCRFDILSASKPATELNEGDEPRTACIRSSGAKTPLGNCSSELSNASSNVASAKFDSNCHLIWCDHRAFKDASSTLKDELQAETQLPVKTHKTAENCMRLLRKKRNAQSRPPCVFLVSTANAPSLVAFLEEATYVHAKVVVLSDARGGRRRDLGLEDILRQSPVVHTNASTWAQAVHAVGKAVAEQQLEFE